MTDASAPEHETKSINVPRIPTVEEMLESLLKMEALTERKYIVTSYTAIGTAMPEGVRRA